MIVWRLVTQPITSAENNAGIVQDGWSLSMNDSKEARQGLKRNTTKKPTRCRRNQSTMKVIETFFKKLADFAGSDAGISSRIYERPKPSRTSWRALDVSPAALLSSRGAEHGPVVS